MIFGVLAIKYNLNYEFGNEARNTLKFGNEVRNTLIQFSPYNDIGILQLRGLNGLG